MNDQEQKDQLWKILAVICCLILPPLGVLVGRGSALQFLLNCVLTLFFWLPGLIHALYVVLTKK